MTTPTPEVLTGRIDDSMTIDMFCEAERFSTATYFKMQRDGIGPKTYAVGRVVRITAEARRQWHEDVTKRSQKQAAQLEHRRRQALASAAGKKAAESEKHISKPAVKAARREAKQQAAQKVVGLIGNSTATVKAEPQRA
jgi:hypothetical protein